MFSCFGAFSTKRVKFKQFDLEMEVKDIDNLTVVRSPEVLSNLQKYVNTNASKFSR